MCVISKLNTKIHLCISILEFKRKKKKDNEGYKDIYVFLY